MKIGYYTSIEGWGGSEFYLLTMLKSVIEAGHEAVLFGIEGSRLFREAQNIGIKCVAWKTISVPSSKASCCIPESRQSAERSSANIGNKNSLWRRCRHLTVPRWLALLLGNQQEMFRLKRLFREHRVDVMHVNINGYEMAGLACRLCGIPTYGRHCIMPFHEDFAVRRWLIYWTNKIYTLVGGPSKACVEAWQRICSLPQKRCRPIWNGINLDQFKAQKPRMRSLNESFRILAVGRLHPMKGFDTLIKAFGLINDPRAHLTIAGEGPSEQALKSLAEIQIFSNSIEFVGHCEDTVALYNHAHCLILPSVSHESFGFVLAEAMACGLPLITSDYGSFPEINIHRKTGLVVPAGDAQQLAYAVQLLMDNPDLCLQMGSNGRQRAEQCYSSDRMVREMLQIYEELKTCGNLKWR